MAVTSSQTLPLQINLCKKACKACGLSVYQGPAFDQFKKSHIFWVGLSAVPFEEEEEKLPLSPLTRSGSLVHSIEAPFRTRLSFYKTNLVKCAPLQEEKIRYPLAHEMEKCFSNFEFELEHLRPKTVFLLGKQVADFVSRKLDLPKLTLSASYQYESVKLGRIRFVPVHHPSYVLIYKRKSLHDYVEGIQRIIVSTAIRGKENVQQIKKF
jgi:uracil-DNA glycosylase family 4